MAKLALLFAIKKLRQLTLAEETEVIGAYTAINNSVKSLENLQRMLTTDGQLPSDQAKEIEELVYRVEDVVQTYGVIARSRSADSSGMFLPFKILNSGGAQKKAMSEITSLCAKINHFASPEVVQRFAGFHFESNNSCYNNCQQWRQNFAYKQDDETVGLKKEKEPILGALLDKSEGYENRFEVIPIWGLSGTGKSALAHAICNDTNVVDEFKEHRLNIRVSENFILEYALLHAMESFVGSVEEYADAPAQVLTELVRQHLEKSRSLIVLDDVRSTEDWQTLRGAVGAKGCRILVTTRAREVAKSIKQTPYIHEKRPLSDKNSWKLLKRIVWLETEPGAEMKSSMEKMGKEMVKLCEGLPGAIIALGKLLAGKSASEWEMVQKNARPYLSQVMAPSYAELSDDLKLYFLYLGHFREEPEIEPEKLCHLWTIEGLISKGDCGSKRTLLDLTQEHLMSLAQKSMVGVRQTIIELKSCHLVGLMGDMCLSKAEEGDILKVMDLQSGDHNLQPSLSFSNTRRLVIYLGKYNARVTPELARNLRSLRIIKAHEHQQLEEFVWPSIMSNIKKFKALRILDFNRIDFRKGKIPGGIFALPFLRYLSFKGCILKELPSYISNLSYLEVLDLRIKDTCNITIPDVLRRMRRLQHLYLPRAFQAQNGKKLRLDGLAELQTLKNFTSKLCEIQDLFNLKKLRYLDVEVEDSLEDLESITNHMSSSTAPEKWLHSSIEIKNFDCYTEARHNVFRKLLTRRGGPPKFSFEGYIDQLPPHNMISQRFTEMVLSSTQLKEDPMPILENLHNLRRLVLRDDAFLGTKMVCSASGFPQLKQLQLSRLFFLTEWKVENSAMPMLSHLKIHNCEKLKKFPDGLKELALSSRIQDEKDAETICR
ncbi:putative inactive disease susceptibility protein LOV1 [Nicotiana sylvestris]|uniref:Probable disease resistance protein RF9 n=1 Tax=Nicotiana sylvestris TaxID=4096 RepID=A0A1U7X8P2_NICSY|nr:PREDICTED: probable disease resistance protein RF9 [Nicotiana sylvestris]XP_009786023.1 PREDICTED: probable disease resistance protein RF9 [Nicotiana sylvestris]